MSQSSTIWSSQASTIPYEIDSQDEAFTNELYVVDQLYNNQDTDSLGDEDACSDSDSDVGSLNYESDSSISSDQDVPVEYRKTDDVEFIKQSKFRNDTCGCSDVYGQPCSKVLNFDCMVAHREDCLELSKDELDLVVMSQLMAHRCSGEKTKKDKTKDRQRSSQKYFFRGQRVCRQTFCFIHGIERKKLQAIGQSLNENGIKPRVHGLYKKKPVHS